MIAEKESMAQLTALQPNISSYQALLSDLTTSSKVAVWRLIFFVTAVAVWTIEKLFDEHRAWIENRAKQIRVGNTFWYQQKALEFQYGDALVFNGTEFVYPTVNESARIIKMASVTELTEMVLIKVAKLNGNDPEPLTGPEKDAFDIYLKKIKFAGLKVGAVSRSADLMKVYYKVYIDPMVMNTSGVLLSDPSVKPVEDAINNYIRNLPFNGIFTPTDLTDQIQRALGVENPVLQSCDVQYGANPYQPVGDYYTPNAGFMKIDPAFPLAITITYLIA
ncbi:MAG: hypothetical protein BGO87_12630 [Flavobacteriia bacterium 40-80]|nr:MAG: hypothetical protein BGO87_12630 [Flavobacteriia bacterium 40-80]